MEQDFKAKLGIMDTNAMPIVVLLHSSEYAEESNKYTFSYVEHFNAQSRIILESRDGNIELYFDSQYDEEKESEMVILPEHIDELELASYLELLSRGSIESVDIDFEVIDETTSYTLALDSLNKSV